MAALLNYKKYMRGQRPAADELGDKERQGLKALARWHSTESAASTQLWSPQPVAA